MNGAAHEFGERVNILLAADDRKVVMFRAFDDQQALRLWDAGMTPSRSPWTTSTGQRTRGSFETVSSLFFVKPLTKRGSHGMTNAAMSAALLRPDSRTNAPHSRRAATSATAAVPRD